MQWPILESAADVQAFFNKNVEEFKGSGSDFVGYFESLYQQLNFVVAPDGFVIPSLTTADITAILNDDSKKELPKLVYNNTTKALLFNIDGVFKTVGLT